MSLPHKTRPVLVEGVWVDVDRGIAKLVQYLNTIPGIRTLTSCQGGNTYAPYVSATWKEHGILERLLQEFDVTWMGIDRSGDYWGMIHPRPIL